MQLNITINPGGAEATWSSTRGARAGRPLSRVAFSLLVVLLLASGGAYGASSLVTEVRASDGGRVAGAVVLLTGERLSRLSIANNAGQVEFRDLPAATYVLKLSAEGFAGRTVEDVVLPAGAQKVLMVSLQPEDDSGP